MKRWTTARKIEFIRSTMELDDNNFLKALLDNGISYQEFCLWHQASLRNDRNMLRVTKSPKHSQNITWMVA